MKAGPWKAGSLILWPLWRPYIIHIKTVEPNDSKKHLFLALGKGGALRQEKLVEMGIWDPMELFRYIFAVLYP